MVVKELIFDHFWKETHFNSFSFGGVMVLKDLIFNSFSLWDGCGSLQRTNF